MKLDELSKVEFPNGGEVDVVCERNPALNGRLGIGVAQFLAKIPPEGIYLDQAKPREESAEIWLNELEVRGFVERNPSGSKKYLLTKDALLASYWGRQFQPRGIIQYSYPAPF